MSLWIVTFTHPDAVGWQRQLMPHIDYLRRLIDNNVLRASGPMPGEADKKAMLIIAAPDRAALDAIIAADPFAEHGLIGELTVTEWDPIFGVFNAESSMPR